MTPRYRRTVDRWACAAAKAAPALGEHTDEVLAGVLWLSELEIGRLPDEGLVAGPAPVEA